MPAKPKHRSRFLVLFSLACALLYLTVGHVAAATMSTAAQASTGEFIDTGTQRNGMHTCPLNTFMVGNHVDKNLLLCTDAFGAWQGAEFVDSGTQYQGMHACPEGTAMTGIHVDKNRFSCAAVAPPATLRLVDDSTQRDGMHACPQGLPMSGAHVGKNLLLCGTQGLLQIASFSGPSYVLPNGAATLGWKMVCTVPNCGVSLSDGYQTLKPPGLADSFTVSPRSDTDYTLTVSSDAGTASVDLLIRIFTPLPPPDNGQ
jgi:hypothetical protein